MGSAGEGGWIGIDIFGNRDAGGGNRMNGRGIGKGELGLGLGERGSRLVGFERAWDEEWAGQAVGKVPTSLDGVTWAWGRTWAGWRETLRLNETCPIREQNEP